MSAFDEQGGSALSGSPQADSVGTAATAPPTVSPATAPVAKAVAAPTPGLWHRVLEGALTGLAHGGVAGALVGGVEGSSATMYGQMKAGQQRANEMKDAQVQNVKSEFKMRDAQAGLYAGEELQRQKAIEEMPAEFQMKQESHEVDALTKMQALGFPVKAIADNHHDSVKGAAVAMTQSEGGVPPILNYGPIRGQHFMVDVSGNPNGALQLINQGREYSNQEPMTRETLMSMSPANRTDMVKQYANWDRALPTTSLDAAISAKSTAESRLKAYKDVKGAAADPAVLKGAQGLVDTYSDRVKQLQAEKDRQTALKASYALSTAKGKQDLKDEGRWLPGTLADEKKKAELSENIAENSVEAAEILQRRPDLVGALAGRVTNYSQMIGNNDPDISALGLIVENMSKASGGIHGMRSHEGAAATEQKILNSFKSGPNAVASTMRALVNSTQTFIDNARPENYPTHSSQGGSSRWAWERKQRLAKLKAGQ